MCDRPEDTCIAHCSQLLSNNATTLNGDRMGGLKLQKLEPAKGFRSVAGVYAKQCSNAESTGHNSCSGCQPTSGAKGSRNLEYLE